MSLWKTNREIEKAIVKIEEGMNGGGADQESCRHEENFSYDGDVLERSVECSSWTVNSSSVAKTVSAKSMSNAKSWTADKIRSLSVVAETGESLEADISSDFKTVPDNDAASGKCSRERRILDVNRSTINSSDNDNNSLEIAEVFSLPNLGERHCLRELDEMKALIINLSKKFTTLDEKVTKILQHTSKEGNCAESELELPANILLPLKSTEAVEQLEAQLEDNNLKKAFEEHLAAVSGSSVRKRCWKVMAALVKNDLCANYNWTGEGGGKNSVTCPNKMAFSSMVKLVEIVKRVIMKTPFLTAVSEDMLEMEISEWLRNWRDRQETFDEPVENQHFYSPIRLDSITDDDSMPLKWKRSRCNSSADGDEVSDHPPTKSPMLLSLGTDARTPATALALSNLHMGNGSTSFILQAENKFLMQTPIGSESPGDGTCSETTPAGFQTILTDDDYQIVRKKCKRADDHLSAGMDSTDGECNQGKRSSNMSGIDSCDDEGSTCLVAENGDVSLLVKFLTEQRCLLSKSSTSEVKTAKKKEMEKLVNIYGDNGMIRTEKQIRKMINNLRTRVRAKTDRSRTGNKPVKLSVLEAQFLALLEPCSNSPVAKPDSGVSVGFPNPPPKEYPRSRIESQWLCPVSSTSEFSKSVVTPNSSITTSRSFGDMKRRKRSVLDLQTEVLEMQGKLAHEQYLAERERRTYHEQKNKMKATIFKPR